MVVLTPVPSRPWWQRLLAFAIILALMFGGLSVSRYLIRTKPAAKRKPPVEMRALVQIVTATPQSADIKIKALGRIIPAKEVNLQARVSGTVIYMNPDLMPGGIVSKGEILVKLDDTDYRLALRQKKNAHAQTLADLRIEQGNQNIARQEWELINKLTGEMDLSTQDIALRRPQLEKVRVNIESALTEIEKAEIDLGRTMLQAPFDAVIQSKNIAIGSQISSQSSIATLVGIDSFWADVSLPAAKLSWLTLPTDQDHGSGVMVYSGSHSYQGKILRLLPELEKDGLMARLLIEINNPMTAEDGRPPLLLQSFIRAEITGKRIENVFKVPAGALKEKQNLLTVTSDSRLHIQPVAVVWQGPDFAFIGQGLEPGQRIVVSKIAAPIEGMRLEIKKSDE